MSKDLQNIFESITPDNIQNLPVIKDAMKVFIETLEELSAESIDIKNVYSNDSIKEELIKIYLDDLYTVLQDIQFNRKIIDKIDSVNEQYGTEYYKKDAILNIVNSINDEHFLTIRNFKESKGTTAAIKYIYDLISAFTLSETTDDFNIEEQGTFSFNVTGSLPSEFYEYIVRPLAHPLGFTYAYRQILQLVLQDFFPREEFVYTVNQLEVRTLNEDGTTTITDFSKDEFNEQRIVVEIKTTVSSGERTKYIYFDDGKYLKQVTDALGQTYVFYMDANDNILQEFEQQSSIYFDYESEFVTGVLDELLISNEKFTHEGFARLDPNNHPLTGNLSSYDIGINPLIDKNFDISTTSAGRYENYYAPSDENLLKWLSGSFERDVDIFEGSTYLGKQAIRFTNTINPDNTKVYRVLSLENFEEQNIGNEDFLAKEHEIFDLEFDLSYTRSDDTNLSTFGYELIEPIYKYWTNYIDANGVDREEVPTPIAIGSSRVVSGVLQPYLIGDTDYVIGQSVLEFFLEQNNAIDYNPNQDGYQIVTTVRAEPVQFHYNTYDYMNIVTESDFGDEIYDEVTDDESLELHSQQEFNTFTVRTWDTDQAFTQIGQPGVLIGGGQTIQWADVEQTVQGDLWFNLDAGTSEFDDATFGIYRDGVLLDDGNRSALA